MFLDSFILFSGDTGILISSKPSSMNSFLDIDMSNEKSFHPFGIFNTLIDFHDFIFSLDGRSYINTGSVFKNVSFRQLNVHSITAPLKKQSVDGNFVLLLISSEYIFLCFQLSCELLLLFTTYHQVRSHVNVQPTQEKKRKDLWNLTSSEDYQL